MISSVVLSALEIRSLTGYTSATKQLQVLHERGFIRAFRARDGQIILERRHFESVCEGAFSKETRIESNTKQVPNLAIFKTNSL